MAAVANTNPSPTTTAVSTASSPPWAQIVRGPEPDPEPEPEPKPEVVGNPPENGENNAAVGSKKSSASAWNKKPTTSNGEAGAGAGETAGAAVVMGAELWPSLAECTTKVSPKLSSSSSSSPFDISMNLPEFGSTLPPQATGIATPSTTTNQLSVRSPSSLSQKQTTNNSNHHVNSNHARPSKQRFTKRDVGGNSLANGVPSHQSSQPANEGAHYHNNHGSPKPNSSGSFENSGRDNVQNHGPREPGQRNVSGEHYQPRNSFRKGNGGSSSRGDGSHQNYGGRRSDQERGNHDMNNQRSFNGRDASMRPRGPPGAFVRAQHMNGAMFYPAVPPYPNFMVPVIPLGMPFIPPVALPYVNVPELYSDLLRQINYYFSNDNLVRDTYLRSKMDDNGWVHVDVIANFPKVKHLTTDTIQILEAVRPSTVVEVQGDKMRKRDDWLRWVIKPSQAFPTASGTQSASDHAVTAVTDSTESISVEERTNHISTVRDQGDVSVAASQASSGDSNTASKVTVNEANSGGC